VATSRKQQSAEFDREFRRWSRQFQQRAENAINAAQNAATLRELDAAIRSGSVIRVLAVAETLKLSDALEIQEIQRVFRNTYEAGANLGRQAINTSSARATAFNLLDRRSVEFLRRHNSAFVREIDEATRASITDTIRRGFEEGKNPRVMAREIKGSIGLTAKQSRWVENFRRQLETQRVGNFTNPAARNLTPAQARRAARQMAQGNMSRKQIDALVETYRQRMIRLRAETIARTETVRALNEGQEEMWQQMRENGTLDDKTLFRFWATAGDSRVRDSHAMVPGMNPNGVAFGEPFATPGGPTMYPPPDWSPFNCRCRVVLGERRRSNRPDTPRPPPPPPRAPRRPPPPPRPEPRPPRAPRPPQFSYQSFVPFATKAALEAAMLANIAEKVGLPKSANLIGLNEQYLGSLEVKERFDIGKMNYFGDIPQAPLRYRNKRSAVASFDMHNDNYLVRAKGTRPEIALAYDPLSDPDLLVEQRQFYEKRYAAWTKETDDTINKTFQIDPEVRTRWERYKAAGGTTVWSPVKTIKDIAYHENGHRLHGKFKAEIDALLPPNLNASGWPLLVSKYATTNSREYVAESFLLYMQGDESQFYRIHPALLAFFKSKDKLK
jgi:hypothetical protein